MNFSGHLWTSLLCYVCGYFYFYEFELMSFTVFCLVYIFFALFPDIDTNSKIQDAFYKLLIVVSLFLIVLEHYYLASILGFLALIPIADKHRGITHYWTTGAVIAVVIYLVCDIHYAMWSFAGFLTHLVCDMKIFAKEIIVH